MSTIKTTNLPSGQVVVELEDYSAASWGDIYDWCRDNSSEEGFAFTKRPYGCSVTFGSADAASWFVLRWQ